MFITRLKVLLFGIALVYSITLGVGGLLADAADDSTVGKALPDIGKLGVSAEEESPFVAEPSFEEPAVDQGAEVEKTQAIEEQPYFEEVPAGEEAPLSIVEPESTLDQLPKDEYYDPLDYGSQGTIGYEEYGGECGGCDDCQRCAFGPDCYAQRGDYWLRADYLMWFAKGGRLPPLVTTGAPSGVLGQTNTESLFGASRENSGGRSGALISMGYWLDPCENSALEGDYFDLGRRTAGFNQVSSGDTVLARPYLTPTNVETSREIARAGRTVGWVNASVSDYFGSAGIRVRQNLWSGNSCRSNTACGSNFRLDMTSGYRYFRLVDRLTIRETRVLTSEVLGTVGEMSSVEDVFRTTNEFNGGEVGLIAQFQRGRWSMDMLGKMGMGNNRRVVLIDGAAAITQPGFATVNHTRGTLALPSNMGMRVESEFLIIPQFGFEIGYQLNDRLRAHLGYNFIYWAKVARAGDQVDRTVDATQLPPSTTLGTDPTYASRLTDLWVQGINVGLEFRF